jgi:hypothetical protein
LLVDEQSLGEASAEIVGTDVPEILVASLLGRPLGRAFDHVPDSTLGEIDEWL